MRKHLALIRIRALGWLAMRSPCLAQRWGLTGVMRAEITEGPHKGLALGIVMAMDQIRKS